ncbi:flagellar hook-length control protein FliK [Aneurinibacillus terranovensis]|uniref:flagellar hook-length control protein FliK n=1 Tax=Aneurinibacillus terranovensis TaxID=278991 RepID=UPI0004057DA4|nr:flagellar hook-length control protein FliK [Aneurinibacillus terranovensis]
MLQNSMLTSILKNIPFAGVSQIELRPGQIFRGTVLKLFPDNLATVQLGSLTVTAKLETPLELGQKTWLQVQPGTGPVTLKIIPQPGTANQASDPSIEGLARAMGSKINDESLFFIQKLVEEKIPLQQNDIRQFQGLAEQIGSDKDTLDAAIMAVRKGLPLTRETIQALRTFNANVNLTDMMSGLSEEIHSLLTLPGESPDPQLKDQLQKFQTQLREIKSLISIYSEPLSELEGNRAGQSALPEQGTFPNSSGDVNPVGTKANSTSNLLMLQNDMGTGKTEGSPDHNMEKAADVLVSPGHRQAVLPEDAETGRIKHAIQEFFFRLGVDYEHNVLQSNEGGQAVSPDGKQLENIKSAVLHILQHPNAASLTEGIRDQLQTVLQQVTGQQLMLAGTNESAFVQYMLQFPLPGDREHNAVITIESRKKGQGAVDPENCRLFFYLSMQNLGDTMLDVSIVNKILMVRVFNNQPWLSALIQSTRSELEQKLSAQGYRLSGISVAPLPDEKNHTGTRAGAVGGKYPSSLTDYKGVDVRI